MGALLTSITTLVGSAEQCAVDGGPEGTASNPTLLSVCSSATLLRWQRMTPKTALKYVFLCDSSPAVP